MLVIGLTGGIGSGKSTVAEIFARLGAGIIDMDQLSREVTLPNTPGLQAIIEHFGSGILQADGTLNRAALRQKIFSEPEERVWLENLLHPLIWAKTQRYLAACTAPYCMVVIPLLTEKKPNPIIQRILVIDATPHQQMKRTKKRDLHVADSVPAILKTQSSREKRLQLADDVIQNDGLLESLEAAVQTLHEKYLRLSGHEKWGQNRDSVG